MLCSLEQKSCSTMSITTESISNRTPVSPVWQKKNQYQVGKALEQLRNWCQGAQCHTGAGSTMQGTHSPVVLQWHCIQGSHPDWRGQARGQRSTKYHFTLKREELEVGNYRLWDLGSPCMLQAAQPTGSKKAEEATQCAPSVSWAMEEWESSSTSSALASPSALPVKLLAVHCWGGAGGDDLHWLNTRQQSCVSSKIHLSFPNLYGIWN